MPAVKTQATTASVEQHLAAIDDPARRADAESLLVLMQRATGQAPVMWGASIVGFGTYRYTAAKGRPGASCATGFAVRKSDLSVYLVVAGASQAALLSRLGPHKMGKSCLSIKRLADVDRDVLAQLVADAHAAACAHGPVRQP